MPDKKLTDKEVCLYCHQDNEGYVKMFGRFYLRKDHFNGWNLYAGKGKPLPIKFCPICGRPLEIKQTQVYSIQDDFCGVPCKFMEDKINSLQAENEELIHKLECLLCHATGNKLSKHTYPLAYMESFVNDTIQEYCEEAKAEAYKEFAEKLKSRIITTYNYFDEQEYPRATVSDIDRLLKELEGENSAD